MNTPIIDSSILSEEQRQAINLYYQEAENDLDSSRPLITGIGYGRKILLEALFGEELFKEK